MTEEEEQEIVLNHFQIGFRDLYARDLVAANNGDVRMGTFIICAAFLDTLSLTYSAGLRTSGKSGEVKWRTFITQYFGDEYAFLRSAYNSFRNRLLHNYSASGIWFTHGRDNAHLHCRADPSAGVDAPRVHLSATCWRRLVPSSAT